MFSRHVSLFRAAEQSSEAVRPRYKVASLAKVPSSRSDSAGVHRAKSFLRRASLASNQARLARQVIFNRCWQSLFANLYVLNGWRMELENSRIPRILVQVSNLFIERRQNITEEIQFH